MDLPTELWGKILEKTRSIKTCDKLYDSFSNETRAELKEAYESHKDHITLKMAFAFNNKLSFYNGDHLMKEIPFENIMAVKFVKNWNTPIGKRDCVVVGTIHGVIMFFDATTLDYIFCVDIETSLGDLEFHPTKSIMLSVRMELYGRKIKVWKFDENGNATNVSFSVESLGEGKKYYYFHPFEPEIYVFASNYSYNPYHRKLSKVFFCNYDMVSVSFSDRIHSFMYLNEYYTPLKINRDGSFECVKCDGGTNYFCHFVISNFEIEEIERQAICKNRGANPIVWDFLMIGEDIYFYSNRMGDSMIYKQTDYEYKIIYQTTNNISRMFHKNEVLIFVEKEELKFVDLETLSVDVVSLGEVPVDFCVLI
jgi:hypothetical protein